jgi:hypothetical protein
MSQGKSGALALGAPNHESGSRFPSSSRSGCDIGRRFAYSCTTPVQLLCYHGSGPRLLSRFIPTCATVVQPVYKNGGLDVAPGARTSVCSTIRKSCARVEASVGESATNVAAGRTGRTTSKNRRILG